MRNVQEAIFFKDARKGLCAALQVPSAEALQHKQHVTLNPLIFEKAQEGILATLVDQRERLDSFGMEKGNFALRREHVGAEFDFAKLSAHVGYSYISLLFGKAHALDFHSHPSITREYIEQSSHNQPKGLRRVTSIQRSLMFLVIQMALDENLARFQLTTPNFSLGDLYGIRSFPRAGSAALLGAEQGYRLIVNPHFQLPFAAEQTKAMKMYQQEFDRLLQEEVMKMKQEGRKEANIQAFRKKIDGLLTKVCEEEGWLLFGNEDYTSPQLQRIA